MAITTTTRAARRWSPTGCFTLLLTAFLLSDTDAFARGPLLCPHQRSPSQLRARLDSADFSVQREWRVGAHTTSVQLIEELLLSDAPELFPTRTSAKNAVRRGLCRINGLTARVTDSVGTGDMICTYVRSQQTSSSNRIGDTGQPSSQHATTQLHVLWEDDFLAVVDKPQGLPVFPAPGEAPGHSAYSLLLPLLRPSLAGTPSPLNRPQPVHRLDKETGGLLLVAKTRPALVATSLLFSQRGIVKRYTALCHGGLDDGPLSGTISEPLSGQEAQTDYCIERQVHTASTTLSVVALQLHTGRTHQIRRHMDMVSRPVVGDKDYHLSSGGRTPRKSSAVPFVECLPHHCLWSSEMSFLHPFESVGKDQPRQGQPREVRVVLDVSQRLDECVAMVSHL